MLILIWALQHWEYLRGSSQIVLHTSHIPIRLILSEKANDGHVSNPFLAHWILPLVNKNITIEKIPHLYLIYALMAWPMEGREDDDKGNKTADNHKYPKALVTPEKLIPFNNCLYLLDQVSEEIIVWFVDGSCCYDKGKSNTGFKVINPKTSQKIQAKCKPHLVQAAEVMAVSVAKNLKMWLIFRFGLGH